MNEGMNGLLYFAGMISQFTHLSRMGISASGDDTKDPPTSFEEENHRYQSHLYILSFVPDIFTI